MLHTEQRVFGLDTVTLHFSFQPENLNALTGNRNRIFIADENAARLHPALTEGEKVILVPSGEQHKTITTATEIIEKLIAFEADRNTMLIGFGGGVVTDITGFVASVYMRGIPFAYIPSTLLCMVDASLGGKTGVDHGVYKNMVGTFRQPEFIYYITGVLQTLPAAELRNGMAEAIKHACIKDKGLFEFLSVNSIESLLADENRLMKFIRENVGIKASVVEQDVHEKSIRKHLNFGHTTGHAIETLTGIQHGEAVSIGMNIAAQLSVKLSGLPEGDAEAVKQLCLHYGLPVTTNLRAADIWEVLKMDKKRQGADMNFVLLNSIGDAVTVKIPLEHLKSELELILG